MKHHQGNMPLAYRVFYFSFLAMNFADNYLIFFLKNRTRIYRGNWSRVHLRTNNAYTYVLLLHHDNFVVTEAARAFTHVNDITCAEKKVLSFSSKKRKGWYCFNERASMLITNKNKEVQNRLHWKKNDVRNAVDWSKFSAQSHYIL